MSRSRWRSEELDYTLAAGAKTPVTVELASAEAARQYRQALYHRRRASPAACSITIEGRKVKLSPQRDDIISAQIEVEGAN